MEKINEADIRKFYKYFKHNNSTEIRVFDKQKYPEGKTIFVKTEEEFVEQVKKYQEEEVDVYIGGRDRTDKGDKNVVSSEEIFFEIDEHDIKKPEQKEKVEKFLQENNIQIGMSGFSGGGYHFYIPHNKKIFETDEDREMYKRLLTAFRRSLEDNEIDIDSKVFNLERVSRVLGTYNFKRNQLSKILEYNILTFKQKKENHEAIKKLILKYEEEKIKVDKTAIELLEKYKINETDKWLYDLLKKGIVVKADTGGNSVVFKDTATILTRESIPKEEVEVIAKAVADLCEGRTLSALYGWIKKCEDNEIFKIYKNELNKFIKDNGYDLTLYELTEKDKQDIEKYYVEKSKETSEKENPFKKLHYATKHLPYYHEFSSLIGLYGRHYIPILKGRWYQLHGGILQKEIRYGKARLDTRIHIAYPIVTEGGKNEMIYGIKSLIERGIEKERGKLFTISEPISYSPESLIGKFIEKLVDNPDASKKRKIKMKIENKGHFNNDFLEFDECNKLITGNSPEEQQAREYLSKSENPIGKNKVEKRLVDDTINEAISYYPKCTNSYYFQPFGKIPESSLLQGFLRRKLIPVGNIDSFLNPAEEELYNYKLEEPDFSEEEYRENLIEHLELMRTKLNLVDFVFSENAKQLIKDYALYISAQGQMHSEKIANYTRLTKFSLLDNLIKMSCIISASYYTNVVSENAVSLAFMDLVELMQNTYDFVFERVEGEFDYGVGWKGANFKEKECLKDLYDKKALSLETSSISIFDFLTEAVMPVYKVELRQARNRYLDMKSAGLIDSKQIGKNESKVWLKFNPSMHKVFIEGGKGGKGYIAYNMVFQGLNDIVGVLHSFQPLQPTYKNARYERIKGQGLQDLGLPPLHQEDINSSEPEETSK